MRPAMLFCLLFVLIVSNSSQGEIPGIRAMAFSKDGSLFAACASTGTDDGEFAVWDARTWKLKFVHREKVGFPRLAFAPDGKRIAVSRFAPETHLFDAEKGERVAELKGHTDHARCVTFSPDGSRIVTGSYDRTVKIWDGWTYELLHTISDVVGERVYHVDVSGDGTLLAVADGRGYVLRLFDFQTQELVFASKRMGSLVPHVSFSPDGELIAASSWGGYCRLFETTSKEVKFDLKTNSADWSVFSPNGEIAVAALSNVAVYSFPSAGDATGKRIRALIKDFELDDYQSRESATEQLKRLGGVTEPFLAAAMHSDVPEVRMRSRRVRDYLMTPESASVLELEGEAECAAFSPDGSVLVTGDKKGNIIVWARDTWVRNKQFQIPR